MSPNDRNQGIIDEFRANQGKATVQNPFVITKYDGLDPEEFDGIDNNTYPRPRTYVLGVSVNF